MLLPREHGAWAMLITPYVIGVLLTNFNMIHIPLFIGIFFAYLASYPLLLLIKGTTKGKQAEKWLIIYIVVAVAILSPIIYFYPSLLLLAIILIPSFLINMFYAKSNNERAIINDIAGVSGLALTGVAAVLVALSIAYPQLDFMELIYTEQASQLIYVWLLSVSYFLTSIFHVKTLIRERDNLQFAKYSKLYHVFIILFAYLCLPHNWFLAYIPALIKALVPTAARKPIKIGLIEASHCIIFVLLIIILRSIF